MVLQNKKKQKLPLTRRIVIADDHPVFLLGLRAVIKNMPGNYEVVGEACDASSLLSVLATQHADILITDFNMPADTKRDGLWMISQIRNQYPLLSIVVITMINDPNIVSSLLKYNVKAILNKMSLSHELKKGLYATSGNCEPYLSENYKVNAFEDMSTMLSPKEFSVMNMLAQGNSISEIANSLYRTKQTISAQKRSAMKKLGIKNEAELYKYFEKVGMKV